MLKLPTTCACPRCGKPRHTHTKKEKMSCSAWVKENLTPSPKAKKVTYTENQINHAVKFFTAGDK
jgi:hypothetical protein